jgi:hypothetical protein
VPNLRLNKADLRLHSPFALSFTRFRNCRIRSLLGASETNWSLLAFITPR